MSRLAMNTAILCLLLATCAISSQITPYQSIIRRTSTCKSINIETIEVIIESLYTKFNFSKKVRTFYIYLARDTF